MNVLPCAEYNVSVVSKSEQLIGSSDVMDVGVQPIPPEESVRLPHLNKKNPQYKTQFQSFQFAVNSRPLCTLPMMELLILNLFI